MWNYLGQNVFRLKNHPDHYLPKAVNLMSGLRHEMVTWKIKSCLIVIVQIQNVPLTWWPQSSFRGAQEQQLQGNIDRMRKLRYVFLFGNFWDHFYFSTSKLDLRSYFVQLEQSLSRLCFDFSSQNTLCQHYIQDREWVIEKVQGRVKLSTLRWETFLILFQSFTQKMFEVCDRLLMPFFK